MTATIIETGDVVRVKKEYNTFIVFHLNDPIKMFIKTYVKVGIICKSKVRLTGTIEPQLALF